ncbi:hypothetical protein, conserved [Eimeria praecox]|uniref:Uncharacterized protein n=1 Tax=Eimeria praecox TaxID=51316 RepID=U6H4E5_9EIME|nr:hypothetical protein, conserved [Eimeria praecox]
MVGESPLPEPNQVSACVDFPTLACTHVVGSDYVVAGARHRSVSSAAVSVEHSPRGRCRPNEVGKLLHLFKKGMPQHVQPDRLLPNGRTAAGVSARGTAEEPFPKLLQGASPRRSRQVDKSQKGRSAKCFGRWMRLGWTGGPKIFSKSSNEKKASGVVACGTVALRRTTREETAEGATDVAEAARRSVLWEWWQPGCMTFVFYDVLEGCCIMAKGKVFREATKVPQGVELNFVLGSHLVIPLFTVALTVHLRRIPELTIIIASFGSAVFTVVTLALVGWDFKVMAFFMLSRSLHALFVIMLARYGGTAVLLLSMW